MKKLINVFSIFLVWCISFSLNAQCPNSLSGFTFLGEFNNSKYFKSNSTAKWNTARSNAAANGGYLASITSQAENDFIFSNLNEIVFIGYNDAQSEGNFQWDSGESVGFNKFADINTSAKDFGKMNNWNGNWGVDNQFVSRKYIVEIPCSGGGSSGGGSGNLTLNCPSNQNLTTSSSGGTVNVSWNNPTANTTCAQGGASVSQISGISNGSNVGAGTYTIQYQATDNCNNTETCNFTISVTNGGGSGGGGGNCPDNISGFTSIGEFGDSKYFLSNSNSQPAAAQGVAESNGGYLAIINSCLLYTSPSPRDQRGSRMPSSA